MPALEVGKIVYLRQIIGWGGKKEALPRRLVGYHWWALGGGHSPPTLHYIVLNEENGTTQECMHFYETEAEARGEPAQA